MMHDMTSFGQNRPRRPVFRPSFDSSDESTLPISVRTERLGIYVGWYAASDFTGDPELDGAYVEGIESEAAANSIRSAGFVHLRHQAGGVQCLQPEFLVKQIEPDWRFLEVSRLVCLHYFNQPWGKQDPEFITKQMTGIGIEHSSDYYDELYEGFYPIPLSEKNIFVVTGQNLNIDELVAPIGRNFNSEEARIFIITKNSD